MRDERVRDVRVAGAGAEESRIHDHCMYTLRRKGYWSSRLRQQLHHVQGFGNCSSAAGNYT